MHTYRHKKRILEYVRVRIHTHANKSTNHTYELSQPSEPRLNTPPPDAAGIPLETQGYFTKSSREYRGYCGELPPHRMQAEAGITRHRRPPTPAGISAPTTLSQSYPNAQAMGQVKQIKSQRPRGANLARWNPPSLRKFLTQALIGRLRPLRLLRRRGRIARARRGGRGALRLVFLGPMAGQNLFHLEAVLALGVHKL